VRIRVEDQGPGIPEAFLPYVFDRFRQADSSSTRRRHGLGLGLAIVKHLVELHGGEVAAANRGDGPGAVLSVTLPAQGLRLSAAERRHALQLPSDGAELSGDALNGVRVLVVDDESDAREVVAMVLRDAGASVLPAASSAEALGLVEHETPDVLLSDLEMPEEDGYTLIRKLRALPSRVAAIPACALTAYAGKDDQRRALEAGFHAHMAKPAPAADLVRVISALASMGGQPKR
jgi:CheY-like chemotaxis protein